MQMINFQDITQINGGKYSVSNIIDAEDFCKKIALGHYENFPVGSILLPKFQRQDIFNIYAFARIADDIADTEPIGSKEDKIDLLDKFESLLYCLESINLTNPVILALSKTIKKYNLPTEPFIKLIKAFKMDSDFQMPKTYKDLEFYCIHSANPVGELVLRVFDLYDDSTAPLSDAICTGLQLVNFWQDLSSDLKNGRCYIPEELLVKYNLHYFDYYSWKADPLFEKCLTEIYDYTEKFFVIGKDLIKLLSPLRLKFEIGATLSGGKEILNKSIALKSNILNVRPKLNKFDMFKIFINAIF